MNLLSISNELTFGLPTLAGSVFYPALAAPPRGSVQKRPTGVISKPANGSGPELLEVVPDRELSKQGKSDFFLKACKKIGFRSQRPRFLEVPLVSSQGFSGAEG